MAHGRIRTLVVAFLVALRCVSAAVVTRQGEAAPCSLLINSATAIRQQGELDGKSAGIEALSGILSSANPTGNVQYYPVVAVLGAQSLFESGPQTDESERINLSPAVQLQDEICFHAMQDKKADTLEASCRTVCTRLQTGEASIAWHETDLGNLPFLFIGEDAQQYAGCKQIEYPDYRAALGWVCKGLTPAVSGSAQGAGLQVETASSARSVASLAMLAAGAAVVATLL